MVSEKFVHLAPMFSPMKLWKAEKNLMISLRRERLRKENRRKKRTVTGQSKLVISNLLQKGRTRKKWKQELSCRKKKKMRIKEFKKQKYAQIFRLISPNSGRIAIGCTLSNPFLLHLLSPFIIFNENTFIIFII